MLKYLIQRGYVNVSKMLLNIYPELNITENELVIILKLFEMLKNNQISISVSQLAKKTNMNQSDLSNVLASLFDKNLLTINVNYNNGKVKETFSLDALIKKIEDKFSNDIAEEESNFNENNVKKIVNFVEDTFKRNLSNLELEIIIDWANNNVPLEKIQRALSVALKNNKTNLKYVDSVLVKLDDKQDLASEEQSRLLAEFYRKIK